MGIKAAAKKRASAESLNGLFGQFAAPSSTLPSLLTLHKQGKDFDITARMSL
jgi:hypothetical protein